jgi:hypothetical protein
MSAHSIELLHPTDPPGRRALRLVVLLVALGIFVGAVVWGMAPRPSLPPATSSGPNMQNP